MWVCFFHSQHQCLNKCSSCLNSKSNSNNHELIVFFYALFFRFFCVFISVVDSQKWCTTTIQNNNVYYEIIVKLISNPVQLVAIYIYILFVLFCLLNVKVQFVYCSLTVLRASKIAERWNQNMFLNKMGFGRAIVCHSDILCEYALHKHPKV